MIAQIEPRAWPSGSHMAAITFVDADHPLPVVYAETGEYDSRQGAVTAAVQVVQAIAKGLGRPVLIKGA